MAARRLPLVRARRHSRNITAPFIEEAAKCPMHLRLRQQLIALAVSLFLDRLARCSRNGRQRDDERAATVLANTQPLLLSRTLMSRSMANMTSMRSTASAAVGALVSQARSKNLRRPWAQHAASMIGPGVRLASYSLPNPA